jgi:predicted phosphodiesterase
MTAPLRVAFIADIHHGNDQMTKRGSTALGLVEEFRAFVEKTNPDFVVDLGDRISDIDRATDLELEREVAEALKPIRQPLYHVCGNHDREYLSVAENEEILGQTLRNETIDIGEWRLVLFRADSKIYRPGGLILNEADLLWLANVARTADRPLLIVNHVPISGHSQIGNYWFEANPDSSTYFGADRARAALRLARVPVVWVSGHVHWNTLTQIDGMPHFTLQSLTESFVTSPEPAAAWTLLELGEEIALKVFGRDPFEAKLSRARLAQRWITPLPRFDLMPERRIPEGDR